MREYLAEKDGAIYFVDFGGGATKGFYPEESEWKILNEEVNTVDGIYILGKALWQLWTEELRLIPRGNAGGFRGEAGT
jgi:hypothetical protein